MPGSQIPSLCSPPCNCGLLSKKNKSQECIWSLPSQNTLGIPRAMQNLQLWKAKGYLYDDPMLLLCSLALTWTQFSVGCPLERECSKLIMRKRHLASCLSPIQRGWKQNSKEQKIFSLTIPQPAAQIFWKARKEYQSSKLLPLKKEKKIIRWVLVVQRYYNESVPDFNNRVYFKLLIVLLNANNIGVFLVCRSLSEVLFI